jgi:hypothetical protein
MSLKLMKSYQKQIEALDKKLSAAREVAYKELWQEILETKFLGKIKWKLNYVSGRNTLCVNSYHDKQNNSELENLFKKIAEIYSIGYHCSFDIEKGINLRLDDGVAQLVNFTSKSGYQKETCPPEKFIEFLIKHNIKLDHTEIDEILIETKERQEVLKNLLSMYSKVLK